MPRSVQSPTFSSETLYALSNIAAQEKSWKPLLDDLLTFSHDEFLVDNLAIYMTDGANNRLEVVYAKAFGRGKSGEADVSWGEALASQVAQEMKTICDEPDSTDKDNRLNFPFTLAMPLSPISSEFGAIVFIRFGGPHFNSQEITYANYLRQQINFILQKKYYRNFPIELRNKRILVSCNKILSIQFLMNCAIHSVLSKVTPPPCYVKIPSGTPAHRLIFCASSIGKQIT